MKQAMNEMLSVVAAAMLIACTAYTPLAQAADSAGAVRIGYVDLVNSQVITRTMGLHAKAMGMPVKYIKFESGGDLNRAIAADQIDFGAVGNPPAALGITRGLGYKGIVSLDYLGGVEALVVRKDKGLDSLKDLVGKTVAVPFGSTSHYSLIAALNGAGVAPSSVKLLDMAPSDAMAAWTRGDIDAAYIWEPILGHMVESGGKTLIDSGEMAKKGYPTWDVAVVTTAFAQKHPAAVTKFVQAECEGIAYWQSKPDDAAKMISKALSQPEAEVKRMMDGTHEIACADQVGPTYLGTAEKKGAFADTLLSTAEFLHSQKRLPSVSPAAAYQDFISPQYLQQYLKTAH